MKHILLTLAAYFSATGTTEAVAKDLAEVTGGTFFCYCRIGICSACDTVQVWPESSFTRGSGFDF